MRTHCLHIHRTVAHVLTLLTIATVGAGAQDDAFPLRFTPRTVIGADAFLERPIGAAIAPDGGLIISDLGSKKILKFRGDGTLQWRVGGAGSGPGEYIAPSRVVAMFDGTVLVYDVGRPQLTRLNADGAYRDMVELNVGFLIVDNIVGLSGGEVAVSGIAKAGAGADTAAAIHVFDANLRHVRSFGPLPIMKNPSLMPYWGAGGLSVGPSGELVFTRRHPYEIYRYTVDGRLLSTVRSTLPLSGSPDDAFATRTSGGTTTMSAPIGITLTRKAYVLADGRVLSGRITGTTGTLDLFSASGAELATRQGLPEGWLQIAAYDPLRGMIWVFGEVNDVPVLLRLAVQ